MRHGQNVLRVGSPGSGKTLATAYSIVHSDGAEVILDPHPDGLVHELLPHITSNVLYLNLSDLRHTLGFELLRPSTNPDPVLRELENQMQAEAFVEILLSRRGGDSLASTPLLEEWIFASLQLYLNQSRY